ncbi:hypothetical protein SCLCIDRAFT_243824 [Scleroderma citrinum Foug A]|uniref:AMP-dependent synthetase/ligase domain-containing protein n=1 Tax=Scleroderma citrinum Foug A TaxID=1036808 RepID=A0A0C3DJ47_9AGAM|nr:hypothetical protein SCLCIDRAFT_243824 [Scleroderma citrinum Foug A]
MVNRDRQQSYGIYGAISVVPGNVAPWAAGLITYHRSFLLVHALFALADPTLTRISATFVTLFTDWICYMQEEWDMLLSSIRDGVIPDVDHIGHVRDYLQINMRADPQRANELTSIGPPLSFPEWAPRVWTNLNTLVCICGGTFATALPLARSVIGPDIVIQSLGYGSTECILGKPLDATTFVVDTKDVAEYLDIADIQTDQNILQAWDLQPGKLYQPVVTTRDGLWRYIIDDILHVIGFDPRSGQPVFRYYGRSSLAIQFPHAVIKEVDLVKVVQALSQEDIVQVHEFTTVVDRRELPETVGFVLEVTGDIGPNANIARQKALDVLVTTNGEHQGAFDAGLLRPPTIRIVKYGTFAGYRRWRGERLNVSVGQMKVPVVMADTDTLNWLAEQIVREL